MAKKSKSAGMKQYEDMRHGFESIDYKSDRTYITRREKYRALFLSQFIVEHPQLDSRATRYFLTKLFDSGSVACYRIPHTDIPAFAPYSCNAYVSFPFDYFKESVASWLCDFWIETVLLDCCNQ